MVTRANIEIKTNARQVIYNLSKRLQRLDKGSEEAVLTTSELGKSYAIQIMPIDTGATAKATKWTKGKSGKASKSATVIFGNGHPEVKARIGNFTKYMNEVPRVSPYYRHFTSGEPHFIDKTSRVMRDAFGQKMRRVVNAFVNGK